MDRGSTALIIDGKSLGAGGPSFCAVCERVGILKSKRNEIFARIFKPRGQNRRPSWQPKLWPEEGAAQVIRRCTRPVGPCFVGSSCCRNQKVFFAASPLSGPDGY
jgi:hypothetical protein